MIKSSTILHFSRIIALIVVGWLPFHMGNTGNDQPQSPTWDVVYVPPYPQIILGYTNETLWYPWGESNPSRTPWVIDNGSYVMDGNYETPWITERLEADSCNSLFPFTLATYRKRNLFRQEIIKPEIPQYIQDQCLFDSLTSIGLSDDFMATPKKVFNKLFDRQTSIPYGVGLLNMHALLKFFTSDEASELKVTSYANEADKQVRVAVVDDQKLYYSSSLNDTTASRHYPMFHYLVMPMPHLIRTHPDMVFKFHKSYSHPTLPFALAMGIQLSATPSSLVRFIAPD